MRVPCGGELKELTLQQSDKGEHLRIYGTLEPEKIHFTEGMSTLTCSTHTYTRTNPGCHSSQIKGCTDYHELNACSCLLGVKIEL